MMTNAPTGTLEEGTPEERNQIWENLKALWRSIPDPTEEELRPPFVRDDDWQLCQQAPAAVRNGILDPYRQQWKKYRKGEGSRRRSKPKVCARIHKTKRR